MPELDYDTFFRRPGEIEIRLCEVCDSECVVERSIHDIDGLVYDKFSCPHAKEAWHIEAYILDKRSDMEHEKEAYSTWCEIQQLIRRNRGPKWHSRKRKMEPGCMELRYEKQVKNESSKS